MTHRGYEARIEFDDRDGMLHGQVAGIRDVVTFAGRSVDQVAAAFRDSVDDYIEFCEGDGKEPERPFSGELSVRISPGLHRVLDEIASKEQMSVDAWIAKRLQAEYATAGSLSPPAAEPEPAPAAG